MNKHLIKLMDSEMHDLQNQVFYFNGILDKITEWLEDEIGYNEPVLSGEEKLSDDTFKIHEGRSECATSLLDQIKKWENDDE